MCYTMNVGVSAIIQHAYNFIHFVTSHTEANICKHAQFFCCYSRKVCSSKQETFGITASGFCTGLMPFLLPSRQCQTSVETISWKMAGKRVCLFRVAQKQTTGYFESNGCCALAHNFIKFMLFNFENSFTGKLSSKFAIKSPLNITTHSKKRRYNTL